MKKRFVRCFPEFGDRLAQSPYICAWFPFRSGGGANESRSRYIAENKVFSILRIVETLFRAGSPLFPSMSLNKIAEIR